ncbi:MAG: hypothetical protein IKH74_05940, partial [Lachnospiraceae bacterium]|nr:hypothetical protein [Lachnospiraceae bacterium]
MNYQERLEQYVGIMSDFCRDPGKYRIDPFRIFGPLYYVGDKKVCIHLIDTGDGLVLIDSGYPNANHLLFDSIWRLGFDPKPWRGGRRQRRRKGPLDRGSHRRDHE